ncbi:MAG: hypothetical protein GXN99_01475 [Candidatus Nanohaloarchaeota archaeon]|nr:hypothetical protein [Candidatus Nanohaloarchaeota archaeon]
MSSSKDTKKSKKRLDVNNIKETLKTIDLDEWKDKAEEKKEEIEEFVKKKPLLSVLIALGAGIVIGKILRD